MKNKILSGVFWFWVILFLIISMAGYSLLEWFDITYSMGFEELYFTLTSPLEGTDLSPVYAALNYMYPVFCEIAVYLAVFVVARFVFKRVKGSVLLKIGKRKIRLKIYRLFQMGCFLLAIVTLGNLLYYCESTLKIAEYIERKSQKTKIYEEYYVDPNSVSISSDTSTKNLICIYLESMENAYASKDVGGAHDVNYIPNLTKYAMENLSFSNTDKLGGAVASTGTGWTMGALFGRTAGLPFAFPVEKNSMSKVGQFAPGVTAMGDILEDKGYTQAFMCGSGGMFAGRQRYFEQHGNYLIKDYFYAIEEGYIPEDYYVWWGYEDKYLFNIAKTELLEMAKSDTPFNYTMLTVDTHPAGGYTCSLCGNAYANPLDNILLCTDSLVKDFIEWCKQQDFYEDTVIVVLGDHLRMDRDVIGDASNRGIYNCFINCDTNVEGEENNRVYTTMDYFPTILAAMGFEIEGDRLGLGTNLFSSTPTLAEEIGIETLNNELGKYSQFYVDNFQ